MPFTAVSTNFFSENSPSGEVEAVIIRANR
jgi:hypothetical protein